jgi:hypothetical protein
MAQIPVLIYVRNEEYLLKVKEELDRIKGG